MNFTPENIQRLAPEEIFVFGSNLAGIHGAGAAKLAFERFGAEWGRGEGLWGRTYAIPTKNEHIQCVTLDFIAGFVDEFLDFARSCLHLTFLVTPIGCGLAGHSPKDIAPMFLMAARPLPRNVVLPKCFYDALK